MGDYFQRPIENGEIIIKDQERYMSWSLKMCAKLTNIPLWLFLTLDNEALRNMHFTWKLSHFLMHTEYAPQNNPVLTFGSGRKKLYEMNKVISRARPEISMFAPTFEVITINPDKIRDVIGKGGATIRQITEETKAAIDIEDNGTVRVFGESKAAARAAIAKIQALTAEVEPGKIYDGKVIRIVEFGAFVNIMPGTDGLLHISQISNERVANVTDVLKEGQEVKVQVADVDNRGRIKLTMKDIEQA